MQVTETLSDGLKRGFTVVLPAANLDAKRADRLASLGKDLRLPGFRPGKVPPAIVKQRFGKAVSAEVVEESVQDATRTVLTERGLRPARQPTLTLKNEDPTTPGTDVEFTLEMEVLPAITLPDFSTIQLTRLKADVPAERADKALESIAKANRTLEPIPAEALSARPEGEGAAAGDVLKVDFVGKIDGEAFEGGTANDIEVEIGGTGFIPGFAEGLVGARAGEQRTINVSFPDDYGAENLRGKAATFDVTVKEISRQVIPPYDDELAKKVGAESLDKLRELINARLQQDLDGLARTRLKKLLLDALQGLVDFPVPGMMVEDEFNQIWQQIERAKESGTLDEADKAKDDDTLKAEYRAIAERRVRLGLLLAEIAQVNAITVTEQELDRALWQRAMQFRGQEMQMLEMFRKYPMLTNSVRAPLIEDKVVDYVLELASITDEVVSPEDLEKAVETMSDDTPV
ncbi:MAG: trigger factor [Proteobacteria bacterium]|nr:trigger factor [Pseudomonadota bacterium]